MNPFTTRSWLAVGCWGIALGAFWLGPARAASPLDARLAAGLGHLRGRAHPLADRSGRLPLMVQLPPGVDARAVGLLPLGAGFGTVRSPPGVIPAGLAALGLDAAVAPPLHLLLDTSTKLNRTDVYRALAAAEGRPTLGTGRGVVVGIVDTGVDLTHPDFRDATGGTRVAWMLDLSHEPVGLHPDLEATFGCSDATQAHCAIFSKQDIDARLAAGGSGYLPGDSVGHGTHVASIAAGNGGADARFTGGAPEATLIVVNVSQGASQGLADADIANAVNFVFQRADFMGLPAAVNLSLGGDFGPHDGTTLLEKSLASMVGPLHPGHSIVVAAGNSGTLYSGGTNEVLGVHSQVRVLPELPGQLPLVSFDPRAGHVVSGNVFLWLSYRPGDDIAVGVRGPQGLSIAPVGHAQSARFGQVNGAIEGLVVNDVTTGQFEFDPGSRGAVVIWQGSWPAEASFTVDLVGRGVVDAWAQTALDGSSPGGDELFRVATREGTINVPATHPDLIAVGCTINRTTWADAKGANHDVTSLPQFGRPSPDGSCSFSSAGPATSAAAKPEISAPGFMVAAAMAVTAVPDQGVKTIFYPPAGVCDDPQCMLLDAGHALLSGSSMSAPQVTGAVALLFERDPHLTQADVRTLLQEGARRPTGTIGPDYQLGAGALDVTGAMAALDARTTPIVRDPEAAASWLSLSGGYLRPGDGTSSVLGTLEVRGAGGAIADGFGDERLGVTVGDEGTLVAPLARVGPGLYRFTVAAKPGTGADTVGIEATLDGVPVGAEGSRLSGRRAVPIGGDRWVALGSATAHGGCSFGATGAAGRGTWWVALAASVAFTGRARASARTRAARRVLRRDRTDRRAPGRRC